MPDWGFGRLAEYSQLLSSNTGFIVDNHFSVQVKMDIQSRNRVLEAAQKQKDFVGVENKGATYYMNSLLQTLDNINNFRQASKHCCLFGFVNKLLTNILSAGDLL